MKNLQKRKNLKHETVHIRKGSADTLSEVTEMKEEEKKPLSWEVSDPKLPVIRSGHLEDKKQ